MFREKIFLFGGALFILASAIIATQVSWIFQAAKIEESFLNQRVSMALCSAMDVLSADKGVCSSFESCSATARGSFELTLLDQQKGKLDSVINQHLLFYNISVPFTTSYTPYKTESTIVLPAGQALLFPKANAGARNVLVKIDIPSKNELVRRQVNTTFILSLVVLILLAVIMFSSFRGMIKERKIRLQTTDFINAMAHDLKTPISNISLAVTLLSAESRKGDGSVSTYLTILQAETARLKQRTQQILGASSVDAVAAGRPIRSRVDMHELLMNAVKSFSLQVKELQGEISTAFTATKHVVASSQLELVTAITNILDNAVVYSGSVPSIEVRTRNDEGKVVVEIRDNGPGIPRAEQDLIFRKSYRSNRNSETEGSGLGLYLARTLVEKQGGALSVSSDGVNGSCFIIALPVV